MTAQNLWQAHYQILSIISLKEFLKLNINEYRHGEKKCETCGIKYKDDALIECKCLYCNKTCQEKFDKNLKRGFVNMYKFCNHDIKKFILLLRKDVKPYEYMVDSEKLSQTLLPEKEDFYSHLNMADITDAEYSHAERVCRDFKVKSWLACS